MTNTLPTLLIIDDAPEDRATYRGYLKNEYAVLEAERGDQALALCQRVKPDCILLDARLSDIDGSSLLAALLATTTTYPYAIVVLADAKDQDAAVAAQMLRSGAYDYLIKSDLTAPKLRHALRNALNDVALKRQLQEHRTALAAKNRELEQLLSSHRAAFDRAAVAMGRLDLTGRFSAANRELCQITGYTADELIGRGEEDITHPHDRDNSRDVLQQLSCGKISTARLEKRYERRDASHVWVRCSLSLILDAQDRPECIISVVENIGAGNNAARAAAARASGSG